VRIAMGAGRARMFATVMKDVAAVVAPGLLLGVLGGLVAARYVQASLFGVQPADPPTIAAAVAVCAAATALAGLIPASRAVRIDPVRALRWEWPPASWPGAVRNHSSRGLPRRT